MDQYKIKVLSLQNNNKTRSKSRIPRNRHQRNKVMKDVAVIQIKALQKVIYIVLLCSALQDKNILFLTDLPQR